MPAVALEMENRIQARAESILAEQKKSLYCHTDRMFAILLLIEWFAGIVVSLLVSPRTWAGRYSDVNIHVFIAVFLVGFIILPPVLMAFRRPGETLTRHLIASAQMLFSAVLIHLTGGRIESHFHIFGSLAFLSFYRDWKVLIPATIIVALDHLLRGFFFPLSVYGVSIVEPWRWLEHSGWVIFEDVILIRMCQRNVREMMLTSRRQAEIEEVNANVEALVVQRTMQLQQAQDWETMQYKIVRQFSEANSCSSAMNGAINEMASFISQGRTKFWGAFYVLDQNTQTFVRSTSFQSPESTLNALLDDSQIVSLDNESSILIAAWKKDRAIIVPELSKTNQDERLNLARENDLSSCVVFPVGDKQKFYGVIELFTDGELDSDIAAYDGLGRLIAQFVMKKEAEVTRERLAYIVEHSNDAIFTLSADNIITSWNLGAEKVFAYRSFELLGKPINRLLPEHTAPEVLDFFEKVLKTGANIDSYECQFLTKAGKRVDALVFSTPWFGDKGEYIGSSITLHNVTARKEAERRVNEFYSVVSHELRTPLTSIRGVLGLIESNFVVPDSDEAKELIGVARVCSDRLIRLINDMLDLKKIEAGKLELKIAEQDVADLVQSCLLSIEGMAQEYEVKLASHIRSTGTVAADWDKITQVITNLVSNAIKFSPKGSTVTVLSENAGSMIRFSIVDCGPGIAECDMVRLFDKFQQLDSSDSRPVGGTGLGLAISKALVDEHGGKIGVISVLNKGSTFWFELPLHANSQNHSEVQELLSVLDNALLVGGSGADIEQVAAYLEDHSYLVTSVPDIDSAKDCLMSTVFKLVVLNLDLSKDENLDFVDFVKKCSDSIDIPIIAINSEASGIKINCGPLMNISGNHRVESLHQSMNKLSPKISGLKVLIVDDDSELRKVLKAQIRGLGLECIEAEDGNVAIEKILSETPDLILLDVLMPNMNGFAVVEELKKKESTSHLPLIVYTCSELNENERGLLSLGFTKFLLKGNVTQSDLLSTIDELLLMISLEKLGTAKCLGVAPPNGTSTHGAVN